MRQLLYHPMFAWNLVEDLICESMVDSPHPDSHWGLIRSGGINRWLNPDNRQKALEMFVFSDQTLLPGEVDVLLPPQLRDKQHHINWIGCTNQELTKTWRELTWARCRYSEVEELESFILSSLEEQDSSIQESQFDELISWWKNMDEWERKFLKL